MNTHFCTCKNYNCKLHPSNHDKGCDLCMKKKLMASELPSCFFRDVSEELRSVRNVEEASYEEFAKLVLRNRLCF
ncbi:DUF6485 family protein [Clostridium beijerinckii]|uniref:DUF6485 family protein n=1 Tax=Clostridium beijerinckii TaxID=1520 RepID=UPI00047A54CC|nr:DUF6485 family protein [Clostridium beijerinckii]